MVNRAEMRTWQPAALPLAMDLQNFSSSSFSDMPVFLSKGLSQACIRNLQDKAQRAVEHGSCLKDQLTTFQGNSRKPLSRKRGRAKERLAAECQKLALLSPVFTDFSKATPGCFSGSLARGQECAFCSLSHVLWGWMTQLSSLPTGIWILASFSSTALDCPALSHLVVQRSLVAPCSWQLGKCPPPRTEASKHHRVQVTAVPQL